MIDLELVLRASEVHRWAIVSLSRKQSVAEHTLRVLLTAREIYGAMYPVPHNSDEAQLVTDMAINHDLHEVLTGDIPSTIKKTSPTVFENIEEGARIQMGLPLLRFHRRTLPWFVVKIADVAEGLLFLHQSGGRDRPAVWDFWLERMWGTYDDAVAQHPHTTWGTIPATLCRMAASDRRWVDLITSTAAKPSL